MSVAFFVDAQNNVHALLGSEFFRRQLGIATGDNDIGSGVTAYKFVDSLTTFFFGFLGDGATVYYANVCLFASTNCAYACFLKGALYGRGLSEIELAA